MLTDIIILEHWVSSSKHSKHTLSVFAKYEICWCMIFIQVIKYRNYILVTENLHLIFLKYSVGHILWKELIKMMGIWVVTLLNKKCKQDLTATLNYISICPNLPVLNGRLPFWEIVSHPPVWSRNLSFWGKHVQIFNFL